MRLPWVQHGLGASDHLFAPPGLGDGVGDGSDLLVAVSGEPRDGLAGLQLAV